MRRSYLLSLLLAGSILAAGCARRIPEPTPADIPRLEDALASSPGNPEILTQLGIAHYKAQDYDAAAAALTEARETGEATGAAFLYLGLTYEDQEEWGDARDAYTSYIQQGRYGPLKEEIERRLTYIVREELRARAQDALSREAELARTDPLAGSVAVFPFQMVTQNDELMPLQVALADMMTTDLALSGALTVLERTQVQSLVTEMALTEAGFTESATGARAGRLLQAEHVVQGAITTLAQDALRFDTDVLNTVQESSAGEATGEDALEQIFELEKETVFQVFQILGVALTPAEREAIGANRAENLQAFLAYGQGLMAMDRGDYTTAGQFFNQAVQLDPGFAAAQQGEAEAEALQEAGANTTEDVAGRSEQELAPPTVDVAPDVDVATAGTSTSSTTILDNTVSEVVPSPVTVITDLGSTSTGADEQGKNREPTKESKGQEGVTTPTTASIRITIPRPGGGD
jgi:tetratricopeptide (TPR) repeat protein